MSVLLSKKRQKALEKTNLIVNLLELIQVMQKKGYDTDYEVCKIQIFISEFKEKKIKKKTKK